MAVKNILDSIENLVVESRRMPLMNKSLIDETDLIHLVDELRRELPLELQKAERVMQERQDILDRANDEAAALIEKAKKYGTACVAVRNSSHYGIAGYWTSMATDEGMIGITGTNARPSIAPTFGVENMLGTNPLTIGIPTDEGYPFLIDCATSITQRGKLEFYERIGKDTPAGMVIGRDGSALTDTSYILKALNNREAALAPLGGIGEELGGYKGYSYATAVELLSATLSGGMFLKNLTCIGENGELRPYHLGHFFIVIDPEAMIGREVCEKTAGDILRALRASQKAPGHDRIYTAGEKEWDIKEFRKDKGVPMGEDVQREFIEVRDSLGMDFKFPFE